MADIVENQGNQMCFFQVEITFRSRSLTDLSAVNQATNGDKQNKITTVMLEARYSNFDL